MYELRQRKDTGEYKKMSQQSGEYMDIVPQQSETEWDFDKEVLKWDSLFKELGEAELILEPNPTGFECYQKNLWPTNVHSYRKPKENGDGHIYRVYFAKKGEFEAWKMIYYKKLTSKEEFLFGLTKFTIW